MLASLLEFLHVALGNTVPLLRSAPMCIVNRVEHQVLIMPTESRIPHPNIQPWQVNSINVCLPWELHQAVDVGRDVVQIPRMIQILHLIWMDHFLILVAKARSKLAGGDISCIFNLGVVADLIIYHLPKVTFYLLVFRFFT